MHRRKKASCVRRLFYIDILDALLDVPHEGTETEEWVIEVDLMKTVQEWLNPLVVTDSDDGTVGAWPCVTAEMWLAGYTSTACDLWKECVALAEGRVERLRYQILKSLIVCYKYTFHNFQLSIINSI